jgi:hypothetical protein
MNRTIVVELASIAESQRGYQQEVVATNKLEHGEASRFAAPHG